MSNDIASGQYYVSKALEADAQRWRDSMSSNALVRTYGPEYANPQMAQQATAANETQQMTPLKVAGENQRQNFLAQSYPLQVQAQQNQNVLSGQQIAQGDIATNQAQGVAQRQQIVSLVTNIDQAIDQGHDPGQVFDSAVEAASQLTGAPKEKFAQYRDQFMKDPKGTIAKWRQGVPAAETGAMTPAQRVSVGTAALANQKTRGEIAGQDQEAGKKYLDMLGVKSPQDAAQKVAGMQSYQQRSNTMMDQIATAQEQASKLQGNSKLRALSAMIPGTAEYNFAQTLKQIQDNAGLADLQGMRETGFTFGRVAVAEMQSAGHAFANITPGSSIDRIKEQLGQLKKSFSVINHDISNNVDGAVKTKGMVDKYFDTSVRAPQPNPPVNVQDMASPFGPNRAAAPQQQPGAINNPAVAAAAAAQPRPTGTGTTTMPPQNNMPPPGTVAPGFNAGANGGPLPGGNMVANPQRPNTRVLSNDDLLKLYLPKGR